MKTWMLTCSGTWVLHGHALWHAHSPSSPYPLRPHVSLALSPLGFSCVSMCGSTVRCIPTNIPTHSVTHACAFLCILTHMTRVFFLGSVVRCIQVYYYEFLRILVHTDAYDASMIAPRGAHPNRVYCSSIVLWNTK